MIDIVIIGVVSTALSLTVFIFLYFVASNKSLNKGENIYPSGYEIFTINVKLLFGRLLKGSKWVKLVRSVNPELDVVSLTRTLPFEADLDHIAKFKEVCKLKEESSDSMPFLYPAVVGLYPVVCIFAAPQYPFQAIGTVHVYNTTTLYRDVKQSDKLTLNIKPDKSIKRVKKGSEVELLSTLSESDGSIVWKNSSKFLVMHNLHKKIDSYDQAASVSAWPDEPNDIDLQVLLDDVWSLGPNASKEYAAVSLDYNPIHINGILAKLFGFPGIIMHGMYLISRAASEAQRVMGKDISYPLEVSTKFTRPCVLPQKLSFRVYSVKGAKNSFYFSLRGSNGKILLDGYLTGKR